MADTPLMPSQPSAAATTVSIAMAEKILGPRPRARRFIVSSFAKRAGGRDKIHRSEMRVGETVVRNCEREFKSIFPGRAARRDGAKSPTRSVDYSQRGTMPRYLPPDLPRDPCGPILRRD